MFITFIYQILILALIIYVVRLTQEREELKKEKEKILQQMKKEEETIKTLKGYEKGYHNIKSSYLDLLDKVNAGSNKKKI